MNWVKWVRETMKWLYKCSYMCTYLISVLFAHNNIYTYMFQLQLVIRSSLANWFNWILPRILIGTPFFSRSPCKLLFAIHLLCVLCWTCIFIFIACNFEFAVTTVDSDSNSSADFMSLLFYICSLLMLPVCAPFFLVSYSCQQSSEIPMQQQRR